MIRLGGRYVPVRRGPRGMRGTPGVQAQQKDDGSIEITTSDPESSAPPAVAMPAPPDDGEYAPRSIDGALTWVPVLRTDGGGQ